jgi:hypothetical protein
MRTERRGAADKGVHAGIVITPAASLIRVIE